MHVDLWISIEQYMPLLAILQVAAANKSIRRLITGVATPFRHKATLRWVYEYFGLIKSEWRNRICHLRIENLHGMIGLDLFANLRHLELAQCQQTKIPMGLKHLSLEHANLHDSTVLQSCESFSLTSVTPFKDTPTLHRVKRLLLDVCKLDLDLRSYRHLEDLRMRTQRPSTICLVSLPFLRVLEITSARYADVGIVRIPTFPHLQYLSLARMSRVESIDRQPALRQLSVTLMQSLTSLREQPFLEKLRVIDCFSISTLCDTESLFVSRWKNSYQALQAKHVNIDSGEIDLRKFPMAKTITVHAQCNIVNFEHAQRDLSLRIFKAPSNAHYPPSIPFRQVMISDVKRGSYVFLRGSTQVICRRMHIHQTLTDALATCAHVKLEHCTVVADVDLCPLRDCCTVELEQTYMTSLQHSILQSLT